MVNFYAKLCYLKIFLSTAHLINLLINVFFFAIVQVDTAHLIILLTK